MSVEIEYSILNSYTTPTGLIYIFNLIIGTGALTLPRAIQQTGWILGPIFLTLICFFSFVTVTFILEAMATTNAILKWRQLGEMRRISAYLRASINSSVDRLTETSGDTDCYCENAPLNHSNGRDGFDVQNFPSEPKVLYTLENKVELTEMSSLYFSKLGRTLFFTVLVVYLFGDLSIYCATVSKSLINIVCDPLSQKDSANQTLSCFHNYTITRQSMYYLFLGLFTLLLGPFVFFNVHKTKYLQMLTSVMRVAAFLIMTVLATRRLCDSSPMPPRGHPSPLLLGGVSTMFGCGVYSFMCHHSLPSVVTPMKNKASLTKLMGFDLILVLTVYLVLSLTGVFAFLNIEDVYTLNFIPDTKTDSEALEVIDYYLILFPVITLSTSYPIIAVTLRNNLQAAVFPNPRSNWFLRDVCCPLFVVLIPLVVALSTTDISLLVGITGSYGGACIQYVIPAFVVIFSRADIPEELKSIPNQFRSPFKSFLWPVLILVWAGITIAFVTINHIDQMFDNGKLDAFK